MSGNDGSRDGERHHADRPQARAPTGELADFLPYRLSVTSNAVSGLIAERYRKRFGLRIPEWRVIAVLGDRSGGAMTQRSLTEATLMDKVAVNRACKVLEERGLLTRTPNATDKRSHLLALTREGRAIHEDVMPLARLTESDLFAGFSEAERAKLRGFLSRLHERSRELLGRSD